MVSRLICFPINLELWKCGTIHLLIITLGKNLAPLKGSVIERQSAIRKLGSVIVVAGCFIDFGSCYKAEFHCSKIGFMWPMAA